jgi:protein-L-isoaspartate O-methyltransferase
MNYQKNDDPAKDFSRLATTYYHRKGPAGIVMEKFNWFPGPQNTFWGDARMPASLVGQAALTLGTGVMPFGQLVDLWSEPAYATIGLGTGTMASYGRPYQHVHYYEIDPAIIHIARDPELFSFVSACRPDVPIILGDARLTLAEAPDAAYDAIIVDAFSSDAIPIHLLTREAMAIYLKKLAPGGIVSIHVSNRHLELASVVAGIAAANGAITRVNDGGDATENENDYMFIGTVTAVARRDEDFGPLAQSQFWAVQEPDPEQWVWTDDYSNIVGALIRRLRE